MPDNTDVAPGDDPVVTSSPALVALIAEAQETWVARAHDVDAGQPGWRPFEDAFPTFYQFTNRPR